MPDTWDHEAQCQGGTAARPLPGSALERPRGTGAPTHDSSPQIKVATRRAHAGAGASRRPRVDCPACGRHVEGGTAGRRTRLAAQSSRHGLSLPGVGAYRDDGEDQETKRLMRVDLRWK
jgi:hypothetical protein